MEWEIINMKKSFSGKKLQHLLILLDDDRLLDILPALACLIQRGIIRQRKRRNAHLACPASLDRNSAGIRRNGTKTRLLVQSFGRSLQHIFHSLVDCKQTAV
jgi:hypothetical protein